MTSSPSSPEAATGLSDTRLQLLLRRTSVRRLLVFVAWTLVGTLSAVHWQLFYHQPDPYDWWELFRIKLVLWYMWGGFTLMILRLGRRFRPEGAHWKNRLAILLGASIILVFGYLTLYTFAVLLNLGWPYAPYTLPNMFRFVISVHSTFFYLAFWATIGIDYAFEYARRSRQRELRESQLKAELSDARLQSLRARLHPHFLFNALNTVASLVNSQKSDEAYDTLSRLSDLLRASLAVEERPTISLREELDFIRDYLEIIRARFPERLTYELDSPAELERLQVPALILQPLVENSVKFGLAESTPALRLEVSCRSEQGGLRIRVRDNGPGLGQLQGRSNGQGIGLQSTRTRLWQLYGDRATFAIGSHVDQGTVADLHIPLDTTRFEHG